MSELINLEIDAPKLGDYSVLACFTNGSIETVHVDTWFRLITDGIDENCNQKYTQWCMNANQTITHWMELPKHPEDAIFRKV